MSIVLLFRQDLCTPIGQQWYQAIEKHKCPIVENMTRKDFSDSPRAFAGAAPRRNDSSLFTLLQSLGGGIINTTLRIVHDENRLKDGLVLRINGPGGENVRIRLCCSTRQDLSENSRAPGILNLLILKLSWISRHFRGHSKFLRHIALWFACTGKPQYFFRLGCNVRALHTTRGSGSGLSLQLWKLRSTCPEGIYFLLRSSIL